MNAHAQLATFLVGGGGRGRGQACRVAGRCIFSTELDLVELSACGSALVFVSRSWLKMASLVTVSDVMREMENVHVTRC